MKYFVVLLLAVANIRAAGTLTVVSAASYVGGTVAPDSIAAAFGSALGDQVTVTDSAGVARAATVFYASGGQVNFLVPAASALGTATVFVSGAGGSSQETVKVAAVAPGLFVSGMQLVVTAPYNSPSAVTVDPASPISLGPVGSQAVLVVVGTGFRGRSSIANVTATVGGIVNAPVLYAGPAPGYPGLDQVNIVLPPYLSGAGLVDLQLTIDSAPANPITFTIGGTTAVDRATQIVSQMTLDEKIQSLHGIQDANDIGRFLASRGWVFLL